jgi:hypothetical protein
MRSAVTQLRSAATISTRKCRSPKYLAAATGLSKVA